MEEEPENDQEDTRKNALAVFFSNQALYMMQSATELFIDGTFSTAPPPFKQIVFVNAKEGDKRPCQLSLPSYAERYVLS